MTAHDSRPAAIKREIVDRIIAAGETPATTPIDLDTIADEVLAGPEGGYALAVPLPDFWACVAHHSTPVEVPDRSLDLARHHLEGTV